MHGKGPFTVYGIVAWVSEVFDFRTGFLIPLHLRQLHSARMLLRPRVQTKAE